MNDELQMLVQQGLSQRQIAIKLGISQTTVRYRLKKAGLETKAALRQRVFHTHCSICARESKQNRLVCGSCRTKIRRVRTKLAAIEYLGGACQRCGFDNPAALEFHHLGDKEFGIGVVANKSWVVVKQELEKCELVCANCHRITHSDRESPTLLKAVSNYNGKLLAL